MIEFTGERLVPGQVNPDLWAEHLSRYHYAAQFAAGKTVLDIGCGTGYGTALLAATAHAATGIDLAADAIQHARQTYPATNLTFTQASATALPYPSESFDFITAFEVIEHLENWRDMLQEARRLLKHDGLFLVSTPNRTYYNQSRGEAGPNPFHVHEFDYQEFAAELSRYFPYTQILLQNRVDAFAFYLPNTHETDATAHIAAAPDSPENAYFFLGACAITQPLSLKNYLQVTEASNVLRDRERHITILQNEIGEHLQQYQALSQAKDALETTINKRTEWANQLNTQLAEAGTRIRDLQKHLEEQNAWALRLDKELETARDQHKHLETLFEERTQWALSLDSQLNNALQELTEHKDLLQRWQSANATSRWMRLGRKLNLGPQFHVLKANEAK